MNPIQANSQIKARQASPAADAERVELVGSNCPGISQCKPAGRANPSEQIQVSVILKPNGQVQLPDGPFKSLSKDELAKTVASPRQIGGIKEFAKANGLTVSEVNPETRTVKLQGSSETLGKAFGVQIGQYKDAQGKEFRGYTGAIQLPKNLARSVDGVLGLSNKPVAQSRMMIGARDDSSGYSPVTVANLYNFPKGTDGTGQTVGIIELGGGYKEDDLKAYFQKLGIKEPNVKAVGVDGGANTPVGDANSADGEVALDVEIVGAVAPGANVVVYFAPNTDQGFVDAVAQAAHDKENHPNTLSISWGAPEKEWSAQALTNMDNAIKDAAALGVNVFSASGDNGSADGENDKLNHADFPASSPNGIGCGGTQLNSANGQVTSETTWNDGFFGGATGGGVSDAFHAPEWQKGVSTLPTPTNPAGGRGVPDVAGNASPATGYNVLVDGQNISVGGTSAVAPLWAALTARLGQGVGAPLGNLAPILYRKEAQASFNDITTGDNGAFKAGPGWDAVTGLGSPDGTKLLATLQTLHGQQPTPAPGPAPAPPAPPTHKTAV